MNTNINGLHSETDIGTVLSAYKGCASEADALVLTQSILGLDTTDEIDELDENALDMVMGGMGSFRAIQIVSDSIWDIYVLNKNSTKYSVEEILEAFDICKKLGMQTSKGLIKLAGWLYSHGF